MNSLKIRLSVFLFTAITLFSTKAQLANPYYSDNDNVAFVGNSITRNGEFYAIISLFQATRFPHQKIKMNNYGCGGNQVIDVMKRVNGDIMEFSPNCISIMLGLNDVNRTLYTASLMVNGAYPASTLTSQQYAKDTYYSRMKSLITTFKDKGVKVLLQSPTMFDEKLTSSSSLDLCNKPLGIFRDSVERWSKQFGLQFVDYYNIMNRIDSLEKVKDPTFTIVSSDRIHPGTLGHFVMAYAYLKALEMPAMVSDVAIDAADNSISKQNNADVSVVNLNPETGGTFKVLAKALPMPTIVGAEKAYTWEHFDFYNELNREMLTVSGLIPGKVYSLTISTKFIGNFTGSEFAAGINLAKYATPQKSQSQGISNLLYAKRELEAKRRNMRSCEFTVLSEQQFATYTTEQKIHKVDSAYAVNPASLFYFGTYDTDRPNEANIISQIQSLEEQIIPFQQLKEYTYTIGEEVAVVPSTMIEDFEAYSTTRWVTNPTVGPCVREFVPNPLVDQTNSSDNVLKITKTGSASAASWNNVNSNFYKPVLNKQNSVIEMKVLFRAAENTPTSSVIQFRGGASSGASIFSQNLKVMDTWQTLSFDFATISAFSTKFNLNKDSVITYIGFFPRTDTDQNSSVIMYIDDIKVLSKSVGTSVAENNSISPVVVYYNHNNQEINIVNSTSELVSVCVTNLSGIVCKKETIRNDNNILNVSDLQKGIYIFSATSNSGLRYRMKFLKQ